MRPATAVSGEKGRRGAQHFHLRPGRTGNRRLRALPELHRHVVSRGMAAAPAGKAALDWESWWCGSLMPLSAGSQIDKFSWFLHVMVLVQAAACTQPRPVRKLPPYPGRAVPVVRGPMPPRFGKP